jgi:hypothetical protein
MCRITVFRWSFCSLFCFLSSFCLTLSCHGQLYFNAELSKCRIGCEGPGEYKGNKKTKMNRLSWFSSTYFYRCLYKRIYSTWLLIPLGSSSHGFATWPCSCRPRLWVEVDAREAVCFEKWIITQHKIRLCREILEGMLVSMPLREFVHLRLRVQDLRCS